MITALDLLVWLIVQFPVMLVMLTFRLLHQIIAWLSHRASRAYYKIVVLRRKLRGEPLWQEHDDLLGMPKPPVS